MWSRRLWLSGAGGRRGLVRPAGGWDTHGAGPTEPLNGRVDHDGRSQTAPSRDSAGRCERWLSQSSLRDLGALAALIHVLVYHEALIADGSDPPVEILQEATYRALRDGLEATLSLGGPLRPVRDLARQALDLAGGYARRLGAGAQLSHLERLLAEGNGAVRQRRAYARGGMPAVLEHLRDETMQTRSVALVRSAGMAA